jgi:hypothetical protein
MRAAFSGSPFFCCIIETYLAVSPKYPAYLPSARQAPKHSPVMELEFVIWDFDTIRTPNSDPPWRNQKSEIRNPKSQIIFL